MRASLKTINSIVFPTFYYFDIDSTITMAPAPFTIDVRSGPHAPGARRDFEAAFARRAMMLVRRLLGEQGLKDLLREEIAASEDYWKKKSSESSGEWRASRIVISPRGLTSKQFLTWFIPQKGDGDSPEKIAAHPEHWVVDTRKGLSGIYVLETLGDKVSQFTLVDDGIAAKFVTDDPSYPVKFTGRCHTEGGIHIGEVYHQFKDHEDGQGFDADLAIYFPAACEDDLIETHRQHLLVEFSNWMQAAYDALKVA